MTDAQIHRHTHRQNSSLIGFGWGVTVTNTKLCTWQTILRHCEVDRWTGGWRTDGQVDKWRGGQLFTESNIHRDGRGCQSNNQGCSSIFNFNASSVERFYLLNVKENNNSSCEHDRVNFTAPKDFYSIWYIYIYKICWLDYSDSDNFK